MLLSINLLLEVGALDASHTLATLLSLFFFFCLIIIILLSVSLK